MHKQDEIKELFSMFHDLEIKRVSKDREIVCLEIIIPWGQVWDPAVLDYKLKLELIGCRSMRCEYFPFNAEEGTPVKPWALRETERRTTVDPQTIGGLGLEVQSYTYTQPDIYVLHCNSSTDIAGGELTITAKDYRIFDSNGQPLDLNQLKQWAAAWWDSVQRMWDKEKK